MGLLFTAPAPDKVQWEEECLAVPGPAFLTNSLRTSGKDWKTPGTLQIQAWMSSNRLDSDLGTNRKLLMRNLGEADRVFVNTVIFFINDIFSQIKPLHVNYWLIFYLFLNTITEQCLKHHFFTPLVLQGRLYGHVYGKWEQTTHYIWNAHPF